MVTAQSYRTGRRLGYPAVASAWEVGMAGGRQAVRWGLRHGSIRWTVRRMARSDDLLPGLMFDPRVIADPYPQYDRLRGRGRLVDHGLALNTAHHDVALAALRSPDLGVVGVAGGSAPVALRLLGRIGGRGPLSAVEPPSMLAVDAPDHTRYRKLVTRAFNARAVAALRERVRQIADELLDAMAWRAARDGRVDLIEEYASLLPATVIVEMLGAPPAMRRQFLRWGAGGAKLIDAGLGLREYAAAENDLAAMQRWMVGHLGELRRHPGDDILSTLVQAESAEGRLSADELTSIALLLLAAGFETTVNLIGNAVALLTAHPEQLALLGAEPARWPSAVDEVLRHDSPVQRTGRVAHRDTVLAGQPVAAGRIVMVQLGGANRDPAVFSEPRRFDVTRPNAADHLAFSSGPHYCLGAALARLEGELGLRALFERFPDLALLEAPRRRPTRVLRGFDLMPVRLLS
jgi:cytochrome P450